MPPKLYDCFITSTNLVPAAVSTSALTFLERIHIINYTFRLHKCTRANIKVGVAAKLRNEQTNKGSNIRTFSPVLV